ncbi:MAG: hypothetical protein IPJ41_17775, partial [Phycisphaerales bacterium]|nr:hypothetical protein [Phycisphaerales bacterium]
AAAHAQRLGNPAVDPISLRRAVLRIAGARLAYTGAELKPFAPGARQAS